MRLIYSEHELDYQVTAHELLSDYPDRGDDSAIELLKHLGLDPNFSSRIFTEGVITIQQIWECIEENGDIIAHLANQLIENIIHYCQNTETTISIKEIHNSILSLIEGRIDYKLQEGKKHVNLWDYKTAQNLYDFVSYYSQQTSHGSCIHMRRTEVDYTFVYESSYNISYEAVFYKDGGICSINLRVKDLVRFLNSIDDEREEDEKEIDPDNLLINSLWEIDKEGTFMLTLLSSHLAKLSFKPEIVRRVNLMKFNKYANVLYADVSNNETGFDAYVGSNRIIFDEYTTLHISDLNNPKEIEEFAKDITKHEPFLSLTKDLLATFIKKQFKQHKT